MKISFSPNYTIKSTKNPDMANDSSAANFITKAEEALENNRISLQDYKILLRDMSDILNKAHENGTPSRRIIFNNNYEGRLKVESEMYTRVYSANYSLQRETFRGINEMLNRSGDKPAAISYHENGQVHIEHWYRDEELHRDGGKPAKIAYFENGKPYLEEWVKEGKTHRDGDEPAVINYYNNGKVKNQQWLKEGLKFRADDKPAHIKYYEDGKLWGEVWFTETHGKINRDNDKPAKIVYDQQGNVTTEEIWVNGSTFGGKNHRITLGIKVKY